MQEIIKLLVSKGYKHVSLSVQKANYAVHMYLKLGFKIIKETDEEFIMVKELNEEKNNFQRLMSWEYCNRLDKEVLDMIIKTKGFLSMISDVNVPDKDTGKGVL